MASLNAQCVCSLGRYPLEKSEICCLTPHLERLRGRKGIPPGSGTECHQPWCHIKVHFEQPPQRRNHTLLSLTANLFAYLAPQTTSKTNVYNGRPTGQQSGVDCYRNILNSSDPLHTSYMTSAMNRTHPSRCQALRVVKSMLTQATVGREAEGCAGFPPAAPATTGCPAPGGLAPAAAAGVSGPPAAAAACCWCRWYCCCSTEWPAAAPATGSTGAGSPGRAPGMDCSCVGSRLPDAGSGPPAGRGSGRAAPAAICDQTQQNCSADVQVKSHQLCDTVQDTPNPEEVVRV